MSTAIETTATLTKTTVQAVGTEADRRQLATLWRNRFDEAARAALVSRFMPLARSLARRYRRSSEPFDDLLQVASLGLLKAIDRFEPERGNAFVSFAVPTAWTVVLVSVAVVSIAVDIHASTLRGDWGWELAVSRRGRPHQLLWWMYPALAPVCLSSKFAVWPATTRRWRGSGQSPDVE